MENIKLEITEEDIKNYLKKHQESYQYKEALFIKYLKDNKSNLTEEMLEILLDDELAITNHGKLNNFHSNEGIYQNIDLSGICHIIIPGIRYYNSDKIDIPIGRIYAVLDLIADKLKVPMNNPWDILESTIDDYAICNGIEKNNNHITFKLSREHCRRELLVYQKFYDENKVKKIRKIIKERV